MGRKKVYFAYEKPTLKEDLHIFLCAADFFTWFHSSLHDALLTVCESAAENGIKLLRWWSDGEFFAVNFIRTMLTFVSFKCFIKVCKVQWGLLPKYSNLPQACRQWKQQEWRPQSRQQQNRRRHREKPEIDNKIFHTRTCLNFRKQLSCFLNFPTCFSFLLCQLLTTPLLTSFWIV